MKLIVGLGNPGPRFQGTYHNVGFEVIDEVASRHGVTFESSPAEAIVARLRQPGDGAWLVKPLTFMNVSGRAVGVLQRYYRIPLEDVLIVLDEVSLPTGRLRIRARGSAGGHNGLKSVLDALGTDEVPRLRVGVGRGDARRDLADHVLSRVPQDLRPTLAEATRAAAAAAELFVTEPIAALMNRFNREDRQERDPDEPTQNEQM